MNRSFSLPQLFRLFLFMTFTFGAWDLRKFSPLPTLSLLGRLTVDWTEPKDPQPQQPQLLVIDRDHFQRPVGNFGHIRIALIDANIRYHVDSFGKQKQLKNEYNYPLSALSSHHVINPFGKWPCDPCWSFRKMKDPKLSSKSGSFFNGETIREKGYPQFQKHHIHPSSTIIHHHPPSSTIINK